MTRRILLDDGPTGEERFQLGGEAGRLHPFLSGQERVEKTVGEYHAPTVSCAYDPRSREWRITVDKGTEEVDVVVSRDEVEEWQGAAAQRNAIIAKARLLLNLSCWDGWEVERAATALRRYLETMVR